MDRTLFYYALIGAPYDFLPKKAKRYIRSNGEMSDFLRRWVEKMPRGIKFPNSLSLSGKFVRDVEKEMKRRGYLKEGDILNSSDVMAIFRFRYNPITAKSERFIAIAEVSIDIIEEMIKEREDGSEKESLQEVKKIFQVWLRLARANREATFSDRIS